jgi:hypothetical protein
MAGISFTGPNGQPIDDETPTTPVATAGALSMTIALGGKRYPGAMPLFTQRGAIMMAWADAEDVLEDLECVRAAIIGLCWSGPDLGAGHWRRDYGRDLIEYGDHVLDSLMRLMGAEGAATEERVGINIEGERLYYLIVESLLTKEEVDEAREDFTDPRPDDSALSEPTGEPDQAGVAQA